MTGDEINTLAVSIAKILRDRLSKKELNEMMDLCSKRANEAYGNALVFHLLSREIILLYLSKYKIEDVCNYKFKDIK